MTKYKQFKVKIKNIHTNLSQADFGNHMSFPLWNGPMRGGVEAPEKKYNNSRNKGLFAK